MRRLRVSLVVVITFVASLLFNTPISAAGETWPTAGLDLQNSRYQATEKKIGVSNVGNLAVKWAFITGGDISATPAVDDKAVYVPAWNGRLFAIDRKSGEQIWSRQISEYNNIPNTLVRATPAIHGNLLIFGDQGARQPSGFGNGAAHVMAVDKRTGNLVWITQVDTHPFSMVTQSAIVFQGRVYVGVASFEEFAAGFVPGYVCCTFRGSMLALNVDTGAILWKTYMTPGTDFSGNAIWGSTPAVDAKRGSLYITTGNNYEVPDSVIACVDAAGNDQQAISACLPADNHFDSVLALDLKTGSVKWSTRAISFDAWTTACIFGDINPQNCPSNVGPDWDFGQGPTLFKVKDADGKQRELLGAGQKSGQYWAFDPDTGAVVWETQVGPGGTLGGLQWGSAVDDQRIYTAVANTAAIPWNLVANGQETGVITNGGFWSALDKGTGQILWQTADPQNSELGPQLDMGPVTVANGVVYACSTDPAGTMYGLDATSGAVLWKFESGGSCIGGAAVVDSTVYWGSGYSSLGLPGLTGNDKLYAFTLPKGMLANDAPSAGSGSDAQYSIFLPTVIDE